jgi:hypothetical protein
MFGMNQELEQVKKLTAALLTTETFLQGKKGIGPSNFYDLKIISKMLTFLNLYLFTYLFIRYLELLLFWQAMMNEIHNSFPQELKRTVKVIEK